MTAKTVERATRLGRVRGVERLGVETYRGLRYGVAQRFQAAEVCDEAWTGTYDATTYKAMACQPLDLRVHQAVWGALPHAEVSEDCLFLNIHAPQASGAAPRPVIVFIHGGSFTGGAANLYDGTALARGADAVVVCINYRLGIFAAFDLAWLDTARHGGGQHWLGDQITALRWIRDNIAGYGGDPERVTIIGESAGGVSVGALCAAPQAQGLVHRAVACSPGYAINDPSTDVVGAIAGARRCSREQAVSWLRAAPASELTALQRRGKVTPNPVSHTPLLPGDPGQLIRARGPAAVPLIAGYATHEGLMLEVMVKVALRLPPPLPQLLSHFIATGVAQHAALGKAKVPAYLKRLKAATGSIGFGSRFSDLVWTDGFRRAVTDYCDATTAAGSRAYVYVMDIPMRFAGRRIASSHGIDLSLTFNVWDDPAHSVPDFTDTPNGVELGRRWVRMLGHFARTGEPGEGLGQWPVYEPERRASMRLDGEGCRLEYDVDAVFRNTVWQD